MGFSMTTPLKDVVYAPKSHIFALFISYSCRNITNVNYSLQIDTIAFYGWPIKLFFHIEARMITMNNLLRMLKFVCIARIKLIMKHVNRYVAYVLCNTNFSYIFSDILCKFQLPMNVFILVFIAMHVYSSEISKTIDEYFFFSDTDFIYFFFLN